MTSLLIFLAIYLLGGITFIPIILGLLFVHAYYTFPEVFLESPVAPLRRLSEYEDEAFKTDDEKLVRRLTNSVDVAAGYFLVTREYVPGGINGKPPERMSPVGSKSQTESPSVYQSMYRTLFDRKTSIGGTNPDLSAKSRPKRASNEFFVVLRHGYLMLYDDEDQSEVRHVISLGLYSVSIYGGGGTIPEGELYIRRNAICLTRRSSSTNLTTDENGGRFPFYMFSDNCYIKEDFYLALVKHQEHSTDDPTVPPRPLRYRQKDVISLVQRLHSSEDHLQMNWVNGLLGRVFLSIYRTPEMEEFFRSKITKKISRVNKPSFLSDIKLQQITVGNGVPYITNPRLKEMTADGDFCAEADVTYNGNFKLEITTKATINLGARFKPREVTLVLAVVLKQLEGHAIIRIKPPPSNRLWVSFERMPKMDLSIEPIVGSRQVAWGPILRIIEGRIREIVVETIVLPHYDDIPFTDTLNQTFRGGIWHGPKDTSAQMEPSTRSLSTTSGLNSADNNLIDLDNLYQPCDDTYSLSPSLPLNTLQGEMPRELLTSEFLNRPISNGSSAAPSIKPERKSRTPRVHTFHSISPPSPSIGTDAINATAEKGQGEYIDSPDATATIMAIRSRSNSSVQRQPHGIIGSPGRTGTFYNIKETKPNEENLELLQNESSNDHVTASIEGIPVESSEILRPNSSRLRSMRANPRTESEKTTMASIGIATAAVRKWYTARRNVTNENIADECKEFSEPRPSIRNLPPIDIPPPLSKRTQPISVPKRKTVAPPAIPHHTTRNASTPILPARSQNRDENVLVVAAPVPDPSTPPEAHGLLFPEPTYNLTTDSESMNSRDGDGCWERKHFRERANEGSEMWHIAEEAEIRTRAPWESNELS